MHLLRHDSIFLKKVIASLYPFKFYLSFKDLPWVSSPLWGDFNIFFSQSDYFWSSRFKNCKSFFFFWQLHSLWSSSARDQIWVAVTTSPATAMLDPLTHCVRLGIEPVSQCYRDVSDPVEPQQEVQKLQYLLIQKY